MKNHKLKIISDGTPEGTHVFDSNDDEITGIENIETIKCTCNGKYWIETILKGKQK